MAVHGARRDSGAHDPDHERVAWLYVRSTLNGPSKWRIVRVSAVVGFLVNARSMSRMIIGSVDHRDMDRALTLPRPAGEIVNIWAIRGFRLIVDYGRSRSRGPRLVEREHERLPRETPGSSLSSQNGPDTPLGDRTRGMRPEPHTSPNLYPPTEQDILTWAFPNGVVHGRVVDALGPNESEVYASDFDLYLFHVDDRRHTERHTDGARVKEISASVDKPGPLSTEGDFSFR